MTLTKSVTLTHETPILSNGNVWLDINWEIPPGWHPDHSKTWVLKIKATADSEEIAKNQIEDTIRFLQEAVCDA